MLIYGLTQNSAQECLNKFWVNNGVVVQWFEESPYDWEFQEFTVHVFDSMSCPPTYMVLVQDQGQLFRWFVTSKLDGTATLIANA